MEEQSQPNKPYATSVLVAILKKTLQKITFLLAKHLYSHLKQNRKLSSSIVLFCTKILHIFKRDILEIDIISEEIYVMVFDLQIILTHI